MVSITCCAFMRTTIILRAFCTFFLFLLSASSSAAIVIVPSAPLSGQSTHIQVVNQYVSAASIISATITRSGNQFLIAQTIRLGCSLPIVPTLTSDFDVGVLSAGTYQVVAQIQYTSALPGCGGATETQSASFTVSDPIAIPVGNVFGYLVLACLLMLFAARKLRVFGEREG